MYVYIYLDMGSSTFMSIMCMYDECTCLSMDMNFTALCHLDSIIFTDFIVFFLFLKIAYYFNKGR